MTTDKAGAHTPGPLPEPDLEIDANAAVLRLPYGYIEFGGSRAGREANARRVRACWNFCEGLAIDNMEGKTAAEAFALAIVAGDGIANELAAARALLAENYSSKSRLIAELSRILPRDKYSDGSEALNWLSDAITAKIEKDGLPKKVEREPGPIYEAIQQMEQSQIQAQRLAHLHQAQMNAFNNVWRP